MASDNLIAVIATIRRDLHDIPDEAWERIMAAIRREAGGSHVYVPAMKKRTQIEIIAEMGEQASTDQLSRLLGVSVRRIQQLKKLSR